MSDYDYLCSKLMELRRRKRAILEQSDGIPPVATWFSAIGEEWLGFSDNEDDLESMRSEIKEIEEWIEDYQSRKSDENQ
jgi:hypothetical protein